MKIKRTVIIAISLSFSSISFSASLIQGIENKAINHSGKAYWTSEKLKNAKSMPMPIAIPKNIKQVPMTKISIGESGEGAEPEDPEDPIIPNQNVLFYPDSLMLLEAPAAVPIPQNRGTLGF